MKKQFPSTFTPQLVTQTLFHLFKPPSRINQGECMNWALACYIIWPNLQLWSCTEDNWIVDGDWGHAFVRHPKDRLYYDAEVPSGVRSVKDLPCMVTDTPLRILSANLSLKAFIEGWLFNEAFEFVCEDVRKIVDLDTKRMARLDYIEQTIKQIKTKQAA